jgi:glutamate formiminotransferase/formiminotetrahydrofolate cyclodeaminase
VRASSGGLQNVQALGFLVDGQAQVSMNLLNFERTPIPLVQEMVRREAARYGRTITKAELIGMAPQRAFMNAATWYLQLDELQDAQVLEYRLAQTDESGESLASLVPHSFLEAVAGGTPTPGGGSVAALAGALGAALTEMIANLTVGRKKYAESSAAADEIRHEAAQLRRLLTKAVVEDSAAYEEVMTAYRNKEVPDEERKENIEAAMMHAGQVPLQVVHLARDVLELARRIIEIGNENAVTDAAAGAIMARAAAEIAALNVKINGKSLKDRDQAKEWEQELGAVLDDVSRLSTATTRIAADRGGF